MISLVSNLVVSFPIPLRITDKTLKGIMKLHLTPNQTPSSSTKRKLVGADKTRHTKHNMPQAQTSFGTFQTTTYQYRGRSKDIGRISVLVRNTILASTIFHNSICVLGADSTHIQRSEEKRSSRRYVNDRSGKIIDRKVTSHF